MTCRSLQRGASSWSLESSSKSSVWLPFQVTAPSRMGCCGTCCGEAYLIATQIDPRPNFFCSSLRFSPTSFSPLFFPYFLSFCESITSTRGFGTVSHGCTYFFASFHLCGMPSWATLHAGKKSNLIAEYNNAPLQPLHSTGCGLGHPAPQA